MEESKLQEIAYELSQLAPLFFNKFIRPYEQQIKASLSPLQFHALRAICEGNINTMTKLSGDLKISKQQLTPLIDKLIKDGFVRREQDPNDRRVIRLRITPEGCRQVKKHESELTRLTKDRLGALDDDDLFLLHNNLKSLLQIINKLP